MAETICGSSVKTKRSLLATSWSIVNILSFICFLVTFAYIISCKNLGRNVNNNRNNYYEEEEGDQNDEVVVSVTSKALTFAALWTMIIAIILGVFGTIVLGFQLPFRQYYWCCDISVYKTSEMVIGSFIGALLMYANLTLVCAVLFGEFQIRDYNGDREGEEKEAVDYEKLTSESSFAFSILCCILTIVYASFSGLVYTYYNDVIIENREDAREEALRPSSPEVPSGYIGERFDVSP